MAQKIITDGDADGFYDWFQFETLLAEREQRAAVLEAEIRFLAEAANHAEFRERMEQKDQLVAEPDLPLDEASYRDYRIRRAAGEGN